MSGIPNASLPRRVPTVNPKPQLVILWNHCHSSVSNCVIPHPTIQSTPTGGVPGRVEGEIQSKEIGSDS